MISKYYGIHDTNVIYDTNNIYDANGIYLSPMIYMIYDHVLYLILFITRMVSMARIVSIALMTHCQNTLLWNAVSW